MGRHVAKGGEPDQRVEHAISIFDFRSNPFAVSKGEIKKAPLNPPRSPGGPAEKKFSSLQGLFISYHRRDAMSIRCGCSMVTAWIQCGSNVDTAW